MLSALPLGHTVLAPGQLIQEFSRASIGTYFDVGGVLRTAPINGQRFESNGLLVEGPSTNLFRSSQDFVNGVWFPTTSTLIQNGTQAPDHSFIATLITPTDVTVNNGFIAQSFAPSAFGSYTYSIYVKQGTSSGFALQPNSNIDSVVCGNSIGFDFATLATTYGPYGTSKLLVNSASITPVGGGWFRAVVSFTLSGSTLPVGVNVWNYPYKLTVDPVNSNSYFWGAQLETGLTASSYIPTPTVFVSRASAATYFDSAGILQTAGVNVQRFGYDPATHAGPFPIFEAAASNQFPVSSGTSCFSILTNVTAAASAAIAPDGSSTVVTVNRSAVVADDRAQRNLTVANDSSPYVFSIYVLKGPSQSVGVHAQVVGGTGVSNLLTFDRSTGVISGGVGDVQDHGAFWRVSSKVVNNNSGNVTFAAQFRPNTAGIGSADCWGAQVEVGSVATSYIPTTTVAVTRAADVTTSVIASRAADFGYLFTPETTPTIAAIGKQSSMKYRALSASGDYVFGSGSVWLVDSPQAVAQAVRTRLQLLVGDWFLDQKAGLDKSLILGVGTAQTRDLVIQQRILETPGVKSLVSYASHVDGRKFSVTATIDTIYGATNITEIL